MSLELSSAGDSLGWENGERAGSSESGANLCVASVRVGGGVCALASSSVCCSSSCRATSAACWANAFSSTWY